MSPPRSWNAVSAIDSKAMESWQGIVWRSHGIDLTTSRRAGLRIFYDPTSPTTFGLTLADVIDDHDYEVTQELGLAALDRGAEGILVAPASRVGTNLVILTDNLRPTSSIVALDSIDPRLYVPRP